MPPDTSLINSFVLELVGTQFQERTFHMDQAEDYQQLLSELTAAPSAEALVETLRTVGDTFGTAGKVKQKKKKNIKIRKHYLTYSSSRRHIEGEHHGRCNQRCYAIVRKNRRSLCAKRVLSSCE